MAVDFDELVNEKLAEAAEPVPAPPGRSITMPHGLAHVIDFPATADGAEPALFLPGLGAPAASWTDFGELLRPYCDGQALDWPGFGRSRNAGGSYSVKSHTAFVSQWIEQSGRQPVHLFGSSLGGMVAIRVAAERPDLLRSLTLLSPALPCVNGAGHARYLPALLLPGAAALLQRRLARFTVADAERALRATLRRHCVDPTRVHEQRYTEGGVEMLHCFTSPTFAAALLGTLRRGAVYFLAPSLLGARSLWRTAERVRVPTLIIWGKQDQSFPVRLAHKLAATIPGSRLRIFDGVGHIPHLEVPSRVAHAFVAANRLMW